MKKMSWLIVAGLSMIAATLNAQIMEIEATVDQEGDGPPMSQMRIMSFSSDGGFSSADGTFLMQPMTSFGSGADQFSMLNVPDVQEELGLVDEQIDRLKDVQETFADRMKEVTAKMKGDNGQLDIDMDTIAKLKEVAEEIQQEKRDEIEGLLLPEQIARLKQVALQKQMKQSGTVAALNQISEELGLSKDELAELREKAKELAEEMQAEMEKLREQTREKLLSNLTDEQQEKLQELIGDKFEGQTSRGMSGLGPEIQQRVMERIKGNR